ncbi:SDR family NAD(P)-dependent oxidoreductase [Mycolicibacterium neoaurum]|uniref:SDR family NAD(P)-dependent oxidoreductase n=1 Tax=Mycolicibacterium neoaurum TaxID=1795 RepID=UPI002672829A|nr:SDR family NAD(P)-dependent oxidoreductase [Mycolicibacterium neoaurum]MDO3401653.1 SDR family NAD(P)-dependent oxidoreductase [Mycolicibacterium neoaurum]
MNVAVVTGAAGAIGAAICRRLQQRGLHIVAVDIDGERLAGLPGPVTPVAVDLTDPDFTAAVLAAVTDLGAGCDVLVNNAGIVLTGPFENLDAEAIRREQAINLLAPMLLTNALLPALSRSRGHVLSVVSLASMMPLAQSPGYCASKAGLRAFLHSLALEQSRTGVRVAMVHPGAVDTPMLLAEARGGGSPLNFLSTPLQPGAVADALAANLDRPRLEATLPRHDGWLIKIATLAPGLLRRVRPLLDQVGRRGLREYLQAADERALRAG